jgi:hypothetical protein
VRALEADSRLGDAERIRPAASYQLYEATVEFDDFRGPTGKMAFDTPLIGIRLIGMRLVGGEHRLRVVTRLMLYRRAEPNHVAVRIHERPFVLSPFGVFGRVDVGSRIPPLTGQVVGILDEQIRRSARVIDPRDFSKVDLRTVQDREAVTATFVLTSDESEPPIVLE